MAESDKLLDEKERKQAPPRFESTRPGKRSGKGCHEKWIRYGPESPDPVPEKRAKEGLGPEDRASEKILSIIASNVHPGYLKAISIELEIDDIRYAHAMKDFANEKPKFKIFQVRYFILNFQSRFNAKINFVMHQHVS